MKYEDVKATMNDLLEKLRVARQMQEYAKDVYEIDAAIYLQKAYEILIDEHIFKTKILDSKRRVSHI